MVVITYFVLRKQLFHWFPSVRLNSDSTLCMKAANDVLLLALDNQNDLILPRKNILIKTNFLFFGQKGATFNVNNS